MEMEDRMESQTRRGKSQDDLICKLQDISWTALSSELLSSVTAAVNKI